MERARRLNCVANDSARIVRTCRAVHYIADLMKGRYTGARGLELETIYCLMRRYVYIPYKLCVWFVCYMYLHLHCKASVFLVAWL